MAAPHPPADDAEQGDPTPSPAPQEPHTPASRPTFFQRLRRSRAAVFTGAAALVLGLVGGGLIGHAIGERRDSDHSAASDSRGRGGHAHEHGSDRGDPSGKDSTKRDSAGGD